MRITRVHLYGEPSAPRVSMDGLSTFIRDTFAVDVIVRRPITGYYRPGTAGRIESCLVRSIYRPHDPDGPHGAGRPGPSDDDGDGAVQMYDGYHLLDEMGGLLDHHPGLFHVVFTDMLVGTYDGSDMRYHGRVLVAANPCIISTTGMVEAPARPRDYCVEMMAASRMGADVQTVESRHAGRFLTYGDGRLQAAAEGYVMQAIFHFETGEAFCGDRDCRLFNAHWQSDLIHSQVSSGALCGRHRSILGMMRRDHM